MSKSPPDMLIKAYVVRISNLQQELHDLRVLYEKAVLEIKRLMLTEDCYRTMRRINLNKLEQKKLELKPKKRK